MADAWLGAHRSSGGGVHFALCGVGGTQAWPGKRENISQGCNKLVV